MTPNTIPNEVVLTPGPDGLRAPTIAGGQESGVSWAAIFAGATGSAALSLILLVLGVGLGLSSVSPWSSQGISSTTVGVGTIVWILFVALAASGMGGYIAGRLRNKWIEVHADEAYFRDTAHGFLAWSVATLVTAGLLTSTIGSIIGAGAQAGGSALGAAGGAMTSAASGMAAMSGSSSSSSPGLGYFTDSLFRPAAAASPASTASGAASTPDTVAGSGNGNSSSEVGRILSRSMSAGSMSPEDSKYVGQLVAQRTGMSQQDAEKRVMDTYAKAQQTAQDAEAKAKETADKARHAAAYASLWLFVSLLLGAFTSSLMATFGGRRRDL